MEGKAKREVFSSGGSSLTFPLSDGPASGACSCLITSSPLSKGGLVSRGGEDVVGSRSRSSSTSCSDTGVVPRKCKDSLVAQEIAEAIEMGVLTLERVDTGV